MNSKIRKDRIRNDDTRDNREVTPIGENERKPPKMAVPIQEMGTTVVKRSNPVQTTFKEKAEPKKT